VLRLLHAQCSSRSFLSQLCPITSDPTHDRSFNGPLLLTGGRHSFLWIKGRAGRLVETGPASPAAQIRKERPDGQPAREGFGLRAAVVSRVSTVSDMRR
jgi:hypothetical protein